MDNRRIGLPMGARGRQAPEITQIHADLTGLRAELWNAVHERLRSELGVPLPYFQAMSSIDSRIPCLVAEVATELALGIGAASKLIDQLEAEGYCWRRESGDPAGRPVELTARGRRVVTAAGLAFDDELERRLGAVVPALALDQFAAVLRRLRRPDVTAV
jgi:DNA-binding MarR family transcriptional regulator